MKRLFTLCVSVLAAVCSIYAAAYPVYIAGIQLTDENLSTIIETIAERNEDAMERFFEGSMDITFDVASNTLTLKNVIIDARGLTAQGITLGIDDMTVVLEGDNIIYSDYSGIRIVQSATIKGSGSITIEASEHGVYFDPNSNIVRPTFTIYDTKLTAKGAKYGVNSSPNPCNLTILGNKSVVKLRGTEGSVNNTTLAIRTRTLMIVSPKGAKVSGYQVVDADGNLVKDDWVVIEQAIEINETNFPDENFRNWLLSRSYGTDGLLSSSEIQKVTEIDLSYKNIKDLKGIEFFTELTRLDCHNNQLTSLDVSKNTSLEYLRCYDNQLTSLDVSNNTKLRYLYCNDNQLTSLDVSKNASLTDLSCDGNQLTSLDVSNNTSLGYLYCYDNQLTSLDVSKNTSLKSLNCQNNQLTSLDVTKNTLLENLSCYDNQLTSLDVSNNTKLEYLLCLRNQLTSLDVSNNTSLKDLRCNDNQLTSLDVTKNTSLEQLTCNDNQLTSLDVSNNTLLETLYCYHNQIKGEQMQALVESLTSAGIFIVIDSADDDEQNFITKAQVKIAKDKGWSVFDYNGGDPKAYAGSGYPLTLTFSAATVEATFGQTFVAPTLTFTPDEDAAHKAVLTYGTWSSSDESVAIVDEDGIVGVVGVGTTTIKLSFPGDDDFQAAEASYVLTVQKGTPEMSFSQTAYEVTYGEAFKAPVVTIMPAFDVTYSSSDESVATVNAITGEVTLLKAGEVTITATFNDNGFYNTASASYVLTVQKRTLELSFSQTAYEVTYGEAFKAPVVTISPAFDVTYSSSDESVATVDAITGEVTLLKAGEVTITATFNGNDFYNTASASYVLTVQKGTLELSFSQTAYEVTYGEAFKAPVVTISPAFDVTYSSSDESVATVDAITGEVTLLKAGEVTITATFNGNDFYNTASASYTLKVVEPDGVGGIAAAAANAKAFDVAGRKVSNLSRSGIYIVNGKKVLVK